MRVYCNIILNKIHQKSQENEFISPKNHLTPLTKAIYIALAVAKSTAERGNSNNIKRRTLARLLTRAFFVRGLRTPKRSQSKLGSALLSMVGRNGQRLIVGCFPFETVFHPVTLYRQAWKLAVDVQNLQTEFSAMIYQFLGISRQHYDKTKAEQIRVLANNETQARALIARDYVLIPLGRLPDSAFNAHTLNAKEVRYA
ncbi:MULTISPECIES: host cell division inhibitor Icd-like protein [unclassified Mannheimia]|uniref:host cell division inhibitor Icd-like protein n=1 Tax=unclassified Mannheimia TaxID=2645054 RepID=UPI00359E3E12